MPNETTARIESEIEVKAYLQNLKYALKNGAKIDFQAKRLVDENRDERFTNQYTVNSLFPDENPVDALKRINDSFCGRIYADCKRPSFSKQK